MCEVTAKATFHGQDLTDIPVLNPGDWFGRAFLIEIGGGYSPLFLVVEADNITDAIDVLADHDKYGHLIAVPDEDLGDYDPDDCHYGPSGQVLDLDHLLIHGQEGADCPFPCRYFGEGCPRTECCPLTIGGGKTSNNSVLSDGTSARIRIRCPLLPAIISSLPNNIHRPVLS